MLFETAKVREKDNNITSIVTMAVMVVLFGSLGYMAYKVARKEIINNEKNKSK